MKKKHILAIGLLALSSFGLCSVVTKTPVKAFAEEESSEEAEVDKVEETTNKFEEIWETYLLPAILSVNVTSVAAAIFSIVMAIKNSKSYKESKERVIQLFELVIELSKKIAEYAKQLSERNEKVRELLATMEKAYNLTEQQITLYKQQQENFENLKNAVVGLLNVEVEIAKISPEYVKSGAAAEVAEIRKQILEIVK